MALNAPLARDTADLLAGLDRFRNAKGSAELYDALLTGTPKRVFDELSRVLRHPIAAEIGEWLRARGVEPPRPPSNDEVLQRLGITDVEAYVARKEAEISRLKSELAVASSRGSDALKAATGYSATTVLLAGAAILGWLAALGVIPINPQIDTTLDKGKDKGSSQPEGNGVGLEGSSKGR